MVYKLNGTQERNDWDCSSVMTIQAVYLRHNAVKMSKYIFGILYLDGMCHR